MLGTLGYPWWVALGTAASPPAPPRQGAGSRVAGCCTWRGSQDHPPTLLWAVSSPLVAVPGGTGAPCSTGMGTAVPGMVLRHAKSHAGFDLSPSRAGREGNFFSSVPRRLQMKSATSPGNLSPAALGALLLPSRTDPRALAGGEGSCRAPQCRVPPPCPNPSWDSLHLWGLGGARLSLHPFPGQNAACLGVPGSSWAGMGWGVLSFGLCIGGWLHWASAAPTTTHGWEWAGFAPSASPAVRLWGFSRESKANEPLWCWKYPCRWEGGCPVRCGLGYSLLGSPGCERPEHGAVGDTHGKKPPHGLTWHDLTLRGPRSCQSLSLGIPMGRAGW